MDFHKINYGVHKYEHSMIPKKSQWLYIAIIIQWPGYNGHPESVIHALYCLLDIELNALVLLLKWVHHIATCLTFDELLHMDLSLGYKGEGRAPKYPVD